MFVDSHCHLNDDNFYSKADEFISDAKKEGVHAFLVVGYDHQSILRANELLIKYPCVFAAIGYHPCDIFNIGEKDFLEIKELVKNNKKIIGIGEIGLDYHWRTSIEDQNKQKVWFIKQINIANELEIPIIVHCRDAMKDCLDILTENKPDKGGIMHCYSGPTEMIDSFIKLGMYISLGGPVTFTNAITPKESAAYVPIRRLLIETDSPYLTPHPFRGKPNMPKYVKLVAEEIAKIRHIDIKELGSETTCNFERLFHVNTK
jgi:TatD DNase family protein